MEDYDNKMSTNMYDLGLFPSKPKQIYDNYS